MTPRIALVTAREALPLDEDMPPLVAALRAAGAQVDTPCWDDASRDWGAFDAAVLRSTWDYVERIGEFLEWAVRCEQVTRLCNPAAVVRWNTDKHYLRDLDRGGVPVVPTRFVEPGEDFAAAFDAFMEGEGLVGARAGAAAFAEFVVKPSVGAGSRDAARYRRADAAAASAHLRRLVETERRSAMLQPYLGRVDDCGETAVIYVGGAFSHAVRKGPLLKLGDGLVQGLFAKEEITSRRPDAAELAVAAAAYAAIPFAPPLYARVDLIRDTAGDPVVLELELTEPSLFFAHDREAAGRLATAILAAVRRTP